MVKQASLAIPNATFSVSENWTASYVVTEHLFSNVCVGIEFQTEYHALLLK